MQEPTNPTPVEVFRTTVIDLASRPSFIHHEWYVEFHLRFVEQIAMELAEGNESHEELLDAHWYDWD